MNDPTAQHERFEQHAVPILVYLGIALRAGLLALVVFVVIGRLASASAGAIAFVVSFGLIAAHFVRALRPGSLFGPGHRLGWIDVSPGSVEYEWIVEGGGRRGRTRIDWSDVERFDLPTRPMGTLVVHRRDGSSESHEVPLDGRRSHDLRRSIERMHEATRRGRTLV